MNDSIRISPSSRLYIIFIIKAFQKLVENVLPDIKYQKSALTKRINNTVGLLIRLLI